MGPTETVTLKGVLIAVIATAFDLYTGAIMIAIIASVTRMFYEEDGCRTQNCIWCCKLSMLLKNLGISLGVTLLLVHVGLMYNWDQQQTIVISGIAAFMGKELIDILMSVAPTMFRKYLLPKSFNSEFALDNTSETSSKDENRRNNDR